VEETWVLRAAADRVNRRLQVIVQKTETDVGSGYSILTTYAESEDRSVLFLLKFRVEVVFRFT
jgi:hypothetical protein